MESNRFISHQRIQDVIYNSASTVDKYIVQPLNIDKNQITFNQLTKLICDDLLEMKFVIVKSESLYNDDGHSIPGFLGFRTKNRYDGGIIKLNKNYPNSVLIETLIHEYIHIKDETLPLLPIEENEVNSQALHDKTLLENVEFHVGICANILIMPPNRLSKELSQYKYNIDKILLLYKDIDKRSVLKWISLIDRSLPCHFACVLFEKNHKNEIVDMNIEETYTYDHISNPIPFDIITVLNNKYSAAAMACSNKKNVQKASSINGMDYYCFSYYENDLVKEIVYEKKPGKTKIKYDRLIIIGWKKSDYEYIQRI